MKYYVTYKVKARCTVEVEADNLEEAMIKAEDEYCDVDLGEAYDVDGERIMIYDENGNFVWEK